MTNKDNRPEDDVGLPRQTEEKIREKNAGSTDNLEVMSTDETQRLVHELRVHQIELEMQKEEMQRAQEELDAAHAKYFNLFDLALVGYFTVSEKGLILDANLTGANLLGVERFALKSQPLIRFIYPEDQGGYYNHLRQLLETGKSLGGEMRMLRRDGSHFWARLETAIVRDVDDALLYHFAVSDITERKRVQDRLQTSEAFLEKIFDQSPCAQWISDENGTLIKINQACRNLLNIMDADVVGKYNVLKDDIVERHGFMPLVQAVFERGETAEFTLRYNTRELQQLNLRNKAFVILEVLISPLKNSDGKVTNAVIQHLDITERVRAAEALRESEIKFKNFSEQSFVGIYMIQDDVLKYANPKFAQMFGYTVEECSDNMRFRDLIHPEDLNKVQEAVIKRLSGQAESIHYTAKCVKKYGELIDVEIYGASILFKGRPAAIGTVLDVTEKKRAEQQEKKLQAQLVHAQKMESIGRLAGGVSHDFNNLLQAISGYTSLLLMNKTKTDSEYRRLKAIEKAIERAAQLVKQLLLFSRKVETERRPLYLNQEVENASGLLERTIPKMINIEFHPGSPLWMIQADPVQIEQILLNLGGNAADAMPDGGKLIIETGNITLGEESAGNYLGATPGNYVLLTVTDTGQGIGQEAIPHIFDPFFTTKEIGKGTGLGLASVYGIVKGHGGYINCYSEIGQGTTFKIYLPAIEQKEITSDSSSEEQLPIGGTETILLVDDETSIRDSASTGLKRFGYKVITATSGEEALEIFIAQRDKVKLVLLDIGMPGMGGYRCLQEILLVDPSAKILISSGYSADGRMKNTLKAGAAGYVGKPYQLNDLLYKIRAVLDEKSK
ncbi:MAG: PAS domain S-box protein [Deltaproteobacteria bacterium]|nr:PAS domain S-box protein [Deltaproteobacteria bacterium]